MKKITKTILLLAFIGLSFGKVNAQYVTIPDANFVTWLTANYPTCMNGNQMDTTCAGVVNAMIVNVSSLQISDLTGIQYFDNLSNLNCDYNQLTQLPTLPSLLDTISCANNQLIYLPNLPPILVSLICNNNQLTGLPPLPNNIKNLSCDHNSISSIFSLPDSLISFDCRNNFLTSIPMLPNGISILICDSNQLTSLPSLHNIFAFSCRHNLISCFPTLPESISFVGLFDISDNLATCYPNYIQTMGILGTPLLPLCVPNDPINNPNNCEGSSGVTGRVYKDVNSNCVYDSTDEGVNNIKLNFYNPNTNQSGITYTLYGSNVFNYVADTGVYMIVVDTLNKPYKANCPNPGIDSTVVTSTANALAQNVNFDIACKNGLDLGIQSITHTGLVFPGQTHALQVIVGDASQWYGLNCSAGTSGQVVITINGPVTFAGVPSGAITPSINGNVYTYTIADFGAINNQTAFKILLTTNTTAQSGNTVCVNVNITTTSVENDTINNNSYLCYNVVNSYDPNYKEVYPIDVLPGYSDWFTYTVHFQNLGTAAAININVLDTLDANLDKQTFEVINYSHYNETSLQNNILNFKFPNILLPDSASNPIGSQGFVQYRIKPKANMPLGTQIKNTAHIYFDYNPAVVTNTTVNNFTTTSLPALPQASRLWLYPNPAKDKLFYTNVPKGSTITIYDILGNVCLTSYASLPFGEVGGAFLTLKAGIYFVKCGNETLKFIKE